MNTLQLSLSKSAANVFIFVIVLTNCAFSQTISSADVSRSSVAASIVMGYDDGVAVEWSSRPFHNNNFCMRFRSISYWSESYFATHHQWMQYNANGIYIVYLSPLFDKIRIFTETGPTVFLLNSLMSERPYRIMFNQAAGLDLFIVNRPRMLMAYSFSVGSYLGHIRAEKLEGSPHVGQGLMLNTGLKIYLRR
jgi:hypothetical protein